MKGGNEGRRREERKGEGRRGREERGEEGRKEEREEGKGRRKREYLYFSFTIHKFNYKMCK